jgi:hypothetical protein
MLATETTYLQTTRALVTSTRAVLNDVTFAMANVTSVRTRKVEANFLLVVFLFLLTICGALGTLAGLAPPREPDLMAIGVMFAGVGVIGLIFASKPSFVVILGNAGGEANGLESKDEREVKAIVDAIAQAIVERG